MIRSKTCNRHRFAQLLRTGPGLFEGGRPCSAAAERSETCRRSNLAVLLIISLIQHVPLCGCQGAFRGINSHSRIWCESCDLFHDPLESLPFLRPEIVPITGRACKNVLHARYRTLIIRRKATFTDKTGDEGCLFQKEPACTPYTDSLHLERGFFSNESLESSNNIDIF